MSMLGKEANNLSHDWHLFDSLNNIWCKRITEFIYHLKNSTHYVILDSIEFNYWLENPQHDIWKDALPLEIYDG